ncbi:MAG: guanylate kinase [Actinobacteria bacterium]|nr:guanylate kinase [Actinomycetota bacterium]
MKSAGNNNNRKDNSCHKKRGRLFIISGPSGTGKSSLVTDALKDLDGFIRSVSVTTRPRRKNELKGKRYKFVSKEEFEKLKRDNQLLECAYYCDFQYGTPKALVEEQLAEGINVILEIEVNGAMQVKEKIKDAFMVFILPPALIHLRKRLKKRNTESLKEIEKRMKISEEELKYQKYYDCIIVNNDYNEALLNLKQILITQKGC